MWCGVIQRGREGGSEGVRGEEVVWCDGGGRHWWVLTWYPKINDERQMLFIVSFHFHTWAVVVICGHVVSICQQSFSNVGGHFRMWVVMFICGQLSCGGGGGGLPWPVLVFSCHIAVSDMAPGFPVSKESGGRGVFTHLLVVIAASDVGPRCCW